MCPEVSVSIVWVVCRNPTYGVAMSSCRDYAYEIHRRVSWTLYSASHAHNIDWFAFSFLISFFPCIASLKTSLMSPQCNVTGPSDLSLNKVNRKVPSLYIHQCIHLDTLIFLFFWATGIYLLIKITCVMRSLIPCKIMNGQKTGLRL